MEDNLKVLKSYSRNQEYYEGLSSLKMDLKFKINSKPKLVNGNSIKPKPSKSQFEDYSVESNPDQSFSKLSIIKNIVEPTEILSGKDLKALIYLISSRKNAGLIEIITNRNATNKSGYLKEFSYFQEEIFKDVVVEENHEFKKVNFKEDFSREIENKHDSSLISQNSYSEEEKEVSKNSLSQNNSSRPLNHEFRDSSSKGYKHLVISTFNFIFNASPIARSKICRNNIRHEIKKTTIIKIKENKGNNSCACIIF